MSVTHGGPFAGQLRGHTSAFVVDGRDTDLAFARAVLPHLVRDGGRCVVLDVDALYSSNSDYIFAPLTEQQSQAVDVIVPDPGSDVEADIALLAGAGSGKTIIVDSLNSVYHLLSSGGASFRGRKLTFVMACMSYLARTERKTVMATMYRRERTMRFGGGRQISDMSDLTFSVRHEAGSLELRCVRGRPLSGKSFSLPVT